jgi:transketolase
MKEYKVLGNKDTRSGFGDGLAEAARRNPNVVALCADLTGSVKMDVFAKEFPERMIQCGIAEADMIGIAAGLALSGKVAFASSFAAFATGRVYDQIRQAVAYSNTNVKIGGSHAGITLGEDGATHQILEDLGLMKMLPNMVVLNPCDYNQTVAATIAAAEYEGPVYMRLGRLAVPVFNEEEGFEFEIGKGQVVHEGNDITIIANGLMVKEAMDAAKIMEEKGVGVRVINMCTIKPLDNELVLKAAKETGRIITAEEHSIIGGLGEAVSSLLSEQCPTPVKRVGVNDTFGHSGPAVDLLKQFGLSAEHLVEVVEEFLK